jgi:hypothetical protein
VLGTASQGLDFPQGLSKDGTVNLVDFLRRQLRQRQALDLARRKPFGMSES